jgi:hypothetical protein
MSFVLVEMNLSDYLEKNDLYAQIVRVHPDLLNQPRIEIFEISLLPSMEKIIPFVDDSYIFTYKNLADFKKINDYFYLDERLASDIEQKYTKNFSNLLEESVDIKYGNMDVLANNMLANNVDSKYKFNQDKLRNRNFTKSDILNFQSLCGFCLAYTLGDRKLHSKQAYSGVMNDLCVDVRGYNSMKSKSTMLVK